MRGTPRAPPPPAPAAPAPAAIHASDVGGHRDVRAPRGMVVSESRLASEVGRDVLDAGGNAVDAAVATGFALAVTHPGAGNIGGGGFMVIRFPDGTSTAIDFREKAPLAAGPDMWLGPDGQYSRDLHHLSYLSVGVPGTVAGLDKAHRLYGSLNWERLVYPAVALAQDGFTLSEREANGLKGVLKRASDKGYDATVGTFSRGGTPYEAGDVLRQPELARTLERIMQQGADGFYRGETARLIAAEMHFGGGLITVADLARYRAEERTPVHASFRGYDIVSMPPPSSGGVAIAEMLNVLAGFDLKAMGHNTPRYLHYLTEAMRRAYRDRAVYLADQDHVDVPLHWLTSDAHAAALRGTIDPRRASVSRAADTTAERYESPETTQYSVVDKDGMAVSVTYTLEYQYGSAITVHGGGFLLNNEMGDFNAAPGLTDDTGLIGTPPNLTRPEQRPLSSMSPTIVTRDGELVAVVGSPGGRTIINTVLQVILNVTELGMGIQDAVDAPRMHHQWLPDVVRLEEDGFPYATVRALEDMGHTVRVQGHQGIANSIMVDPVTGERVGAPDPRSPDTWAAGG